MSPSLSKSGRFFIHSFLAVGFALLLNDHCPGATADTRDWPAVTLRGYGTLSGTTTRYQLPAGPASILQIHCEDGW